MDFTDEEKFILSFLLDRLDNLIYEMDRNNLCFYGYGDKSGYSFDVNTIYHLKSKLGIESEW